MDSHNNPAEQRVVGDVDTHKDLHVAAIVDDRNRVLGIQCFATTRQGHRQMLAWIRSFGDVRCIGIESTGSYGAGLLRFMQTAGIEVLGSQLPTGTIGVGAERTMISTRRTPRMRLFPASGPSLPEAGTE